MRYRRLRGSELEFSEIAFGTGDTAGAVVYGDAAEQRAIVARALELGVTVFDTSPDYGKGRAEVNLGRVLQELGATESIVMTKVEIMPEHLDFPLRSVADRVVESINDSLTRLQRDHLEVVFVHNPCRYQRNLHVRIPWTPLTPQDMLGEVLEGLTRARDAGKVTHLGAGCERADVGAVREVLASDAFDVINVWFNLANPTAARSVPVPGVPAEEDYTGLFEFTAERGIGVAAIRPLAGGALTSSILDSGHDGRHPLSRGYFTWHPEVFEPELARGRRFAFLDRPGEQTIAEAAYRYLLSNTATTMVVGGFSDPAHLDDAARASDAGPLSAADLAAVEEVHRAGFTTPEEQSWTVYAEGTTGLPM